ncbi:MAG: DUF4349 domain-containing protein [Candidatus Woesearchaeota archaeon]
MTIGDQLKKIKDNWLLVILVLVLVFMVMASGSLIGLIGGSAYKSTSPLASAGMQETAMDSAAYNRGMAPQSKGDFAPEVEDRKITKTANLQSEVERGGFRKEESRLKAIVDSSDSFLLNENVRRIGEGWSGYFSGSYQLKVEADKYDSVITQLKELGEVQSFREDADDITGRYTDLNADLEAEKDKLQRYKNLYNQAEEIEDKIDLTDRIANQERRVEYLEDALENIDKKVVYSTIRVTLTEEKSGFFGLTFVKLSELAANFVTSLKALLVFVAYILPWVIAVLIIWFVVKRPGRSK